MIIELQINNFDYQDLQINHKPLLFIFQFSGFYMFKTLYILFFILLYNCKMSKLTIIWIYLVFIILVQGQINSINKCTAGSATYINNIKEIYNQTYRFNLKSVHTTFTRDTVGAIIGGKTKYIFSSNDSKLLLIKYRHDNGTHMNQTLNISQYQKNAGYQITPQLGCIAFLNFNASTNISNITLLRWNETTQNITFYTNFTLIGNITYAIPTNNCSHLRVDIGLINVTDILKLRQKLTFTGYRNINQLTQIDFPSKKSYQRFKENNGRIYYLLYNNKKQQCQQNEKRECDQFLDVKRRKLGTYFFNQYFYMECIKKKYPNFGGSVQFFNDLKFLWNQDSYQLFIWFKDYDFRRLKLNFKIQDICEINAWKYIFVKKIDAKTNKIYLFTYCNSSAKLNIYQVTISEIAQEQMRNLKNEQKKNDNQLKYGQQFTTAILISNQEQRFKCSQQVYPLPSEFSRSLNVQNFKSLNKNPLFIFSEDAKYVTIENQKSNEWVIINLVDMVRISLPESLKTITHQNISGIDIISTPPYIKKDKIYYFDSAKQLNVYRLDNNILSLQSINRIQNINEKINEGINGVKTQNKFLTMVIEGRCLCYKNIISKGKCYKQNLKCQFLFAKVISSECS